MTSSDATRTTLLGLLDASPSEQTAIVLPEQNIRVSYAQLREQVRDFAEALVASGISRGDRVGMALPNGLPTSVAFLAASEAGTAAPANPGTQADDIRCNIE